MKSKPVYEYIIQKQKYDRYDILIISSWQDDAVMLVNMDWQDGLMIHGAEGIEPADWLDIANVVNKAIKEVSILMGDMFELGGNNALET